jgi:hypothetical protein
MRTSSFNAVGSVEGEEESPGSPKSTQVTGPWLELKDNLLNKLEVIRTKSGVKDATKCDPTYLSIEDIISLPQLNSQSSHASKGVSGLHFKYKLESMISPHFKGNHDKESHLNRFLEALYDSRVDMEPWIQENELIRVSEDKLPSPFMINDSFSKG